MSNNTNTKLLTSTILVLLFSVAGFIMIQPVHAQYSSSYPPPKTTQDMSKIKTTEKNQEVKTTEKIEPKASSVQDKTIEKDQPDSPRIQMIHGILAQNIKCKDGLQLVFKSTDNSPACVKSSSVQRLVEIGWAKLEKTAMNVNAGKMDETPNKLEVTATEVDETYRWSDSDGINPTLTILDNVDNVIQIQNPTDVKHEFVIESEGNEVAASGDISPDSSGTISIKPTTTGVWEYHCEYHPTTMKGTIKIVSP